MSAPTATVAIVSQPHEAGQLGLLSDDARDGTDARPDELDRIRYVDYIVRLLDNVRAQSESTVLALIGDWGSGKSSVLEMLQQKRKDPWRVGTFNPWMYSDTSSLHRGFFAELTAALPEGNRPNNVRTRIGEFARTVSPLGKLVNLAGVDGEVLLKFSGDLLVGDSSASAAKKSAEDALNEANVPVLMIIDDLDRLTPDELLEVLKLVRLVGRLPHVYYLLSYDERTLLDVLQRTTVTGDNEERSRAYLEKIVQVRLDMPALRATQRKTLLDDGLATIGAAVDLLLTAEDERRLREIYFSVLDRRLSTPRAITRFLGQIQAFYPLLHGEVDFVDFFLVSWLRTQEPGVYRMLQAERDDLLGQGPSRFTLPSDATAQTKRRERWQERLDAAHIHPADLPGVIEVLSALFPEIGAVFADGQGFVQARQRSTPRAISQIDYFDRYVSFGVPQEDVRDADVMTAIKDLANGANSEVVMRLREEIAQEPARTMRKLDALQEAQVDLPALALFDLIARTSPQINRQRSGLFDNPWLAAVQGGAACLANMGREDAVDAITQLGNNEELVEYVVEAVKFLKPGDSGTVGEQLPVGYDFPSVERAASAVVKAFLEAHAAPSPLDDGAMTIFWPWRHIDPAAAQAWLVGQVESGHWALKDVMGAFAVTSVPLGGTDSKPRIADFEIRAVDEIFGLDRVFANLASDLDAATPVEGTLSLLPATPENRVQHALICLRQERDRRRG
jgi:predicted KAP-like P-loop ATPase